MTRALFVCTEGRHRSVTGAAVWADRCAAGIGPFQTRAVGTHPSAQTRMIPADLVWADLVVCMEERHARDVSRMVGSDVGDLSVVTLGIPDEYQCGDAALIALLEERLPEDLALTAYMMRAVELARQRHPGTPHGAAVREE